MKRETTQIIAMSIEMMKMACSHRKNVVGRLEIDTQQYTQQQQQNNNNKTTTLHNAAPKATQQPYTNDNLLKQCGWGLQKYILGRKNRLNWGE